MRFTLPFAVIAMVATSIQVEAQVNGSCKIELDGEAPLSTLRMVIGNLKGVASVVCPSYALCTATLNGAVSIEIVTSQLEEFQGVIYAICFDS